MRRLHVLSAVELAHDSPSCIEIADVSKTLSVTVGLDEACCMFLSVSRGQRLRELVMVAERPG
jgi:hypothetical protein